MHDMIIAVAIISLVISLLYTTASIRKLQGRTSRLEKAVRDLNPGLDF